MLLMFDGGVMSRPRPLAEHTAVEPLLLRVRDVATMLGISERVVNQLIQSGELPSFLVPGLRCRRVAPADVEALASLWRRCGGSTR